MRLSFVTLSPADIADAVARLGNVIKAHLASLPSTVEA
jgi:DNA-binding transcriptional MocR family regulator